MVYKKFIVSNNYKGEYMNVTFDKFFSVGLGTGFSTLRFPHCKICNQEVIEYKPIIKNGEVYHKVCLFVANKKQTSND